MLQSFHCSRRSSALRNFPFDLCSGGFFSHVSSVTSMSTRMAGSKCRMTSGDHLQVSEEAGRIPPKTKLSKFPLIFVPLASLRNCWPQFQQECFASLLSFFQNIVLAFMCGMTPGDHTLDHFAGRAKNQSIRRIQFLAELHPSALFLQLRVAAVLRVRVQGLHCACGLSSGFDVCSGDSSSRMFVP